MPNTYDLSGRALPNTNYKKIAAGQTTANISVSGDGVKDRDYISHMIIQCPTTTPGSGGLSLFDGSTAIVVHSYVAGTMTDGAVYIPVDALAQTTKGFGVTTPASVSVLVVGRF